MSRPFVKFRRVATLGLAVLFFLQNASLMIPQITESRIWRDITNQTPFYDVKVYSSSIQPFGLLLNGEMKKRHCIFDETGRGLIGYATFFGHPKSRVFVNTDIEDTMAGAKGNRPPSKDAVSWGPWFLMYKSDRPLPDGWEIFAGHWCPVLDPETGKPLIDRRTNTVVNKFETNLFAHGPWATTEIVK